MEDEYFSMVTDMPLGGRTTSHGLGDALPADDMKAHQTDMRALVTEYMGNNMSILRPPAMDGQDPDPITRAQRQR